MESIALTIKFVLFLGMEIFVVAVTLGVLVLALRKIVRDSIRRSRRSDEAKRRPATVAPAPVRVSRSTR